MINENKIHVSIVEDTDDIRNALRVLIDGSPGFECIHVYADAEEALQDMSSKDIDIVLMDIGLPGMDGIETLKVLRKSCPGIQVMLLTGQATIQAGVAAASTPGTRLKA